MRVIVRTPSPPIPIFVLFPSILIFNHIIAVIGYLVLVILRACGKGKRLFAYMTPEQALLWFHRLILVYWKYRFRNPGWKLVKVNSKGTSVTVKL